MKGRTRTVIFEPALLNFMRRSIDPESGMTMAGLLTASAIDKMVQLQLDQGRADPGADVPIILTKEDWKG